MSHENNQPAQIAVLDTNVFLKDPYALFSLDEAHIVAPFQVVQELDQLKSSSGSIGRHARQAIRLIEALRQKGDIHAGVPVKDTPEAPTFSITHRSQNENLECDEAVLATARHYQEQGKTTALYTQDIHKRLKIAESGIHSHEYHGTPHILPNELAEVHEQVLPSKDLKNLTNSRVLDALVDPPSFVNQFIKLSSENNPENYRLFRYHGGTEVTEVKNHPIFGAFQANNMEQLMALDLLMDDSVKLVSLIGQAGTGKTFLVLLAGIYKMLHDKVYRRIMVSRPTVSLGPDIGFLPGDADEKLESWMQPVFDNIGMIASGMKAKKLPHVVSAEELRKADQLCLQAITYMRGRSLPFQFLFVDEAQNLTPLEIKTLITRAGQGTKVIIAGDPDQIDAKGLGYDTNGLMRTTRRFKGDSLFGVVHLHRSERSALAQRAADLL